MRVIEIGESHVLEFRRPDAAGVMTTWRCLLPNVDLEQLRDALTAYLESER